MLVKIKGICSDVFKYGFLIVLTVCSLFPFLWMVMTSFKTQFEITSSSISLPKHISFENYIYVIRTANIPMFYMNSIIVTVFSTVFCVVLVSMAAYVVARYRFKFSNLIVLLFASTLFLPGIALNYPVFMLIKSMGLIDSKIGLIIVYTCFGLPLTFFIMKSYFLSIPKEIDESAIVDGAGFVRIFVQILFPISKPGFSTVAVLQFLGIWNEFFFCMLLSNSKNSWTIPLALIMFRGKYMIRYDRTFIVMVLLVIPTIVVFILMQEQVVKGLTAGAVKG